MHQKVRKDLSCLLAAVMILAVFVLPVQAVTVIQDGVKVQTIVNYQSQDLYVERDIKTGIVKRICYDIASTYSTTGIRYRTTAVTIQFPGVPGEVVIPVKSQLLEYNQAFKASPGFKYGKTYCSQMTITREAIINAAPEQHRETVRQALDNPEAVGTVKTGAHLEIYDVKSEKVYMTLTSPEDVLKQTIMPQHRADMLTRWQNLDLTAGKRIQAITLPTNTQNQSGQTGQTGQGQQETCTDVYVSSLTAPAVTKGGEPAAIKAVIARKNDGPARAVTVQVTNTGILSPNSPKTQTITLDRGQSKAITWRTGAVWKDIVEYTVKAEVTDAKDCVPGNNSKRVQIRFVPDLSAAPVDNDTWTSIIDR